MKAKTTNSTAQDPRIYWAKERTFLAWLRTGLALMGFGFVVARFGLFLRMIRLNEPAQAAAQPGWSMWIGTSLVLLGVLIQIGSAVDYFRFTWCFKRGENPEPSFSWLGLATAACLILVGLAMAFYLLWEG
jgi:putative membrane protein